MLFNKYIRGNPKLNNIAIGIFNLLFKIFKYFKLKRKNSEQIAVVLLHRLGDSVFTLPAIKQLLKHYPKNLTLICFIETSPIYKIALKTINFIELDSDDFYFSRRIANGKARKKLRELNPSIIYDLTGTSASASLIFNCPSKEIIGLNEPYYKSIYTGYVRVRTEPHITENYLDVVRMIFPEDSDSDIKSNPDYSGDYILIHPFAGVGSKEWSLFKYIDLAESLNKVSKCIIVAQPNKISIDVKEEIRNKNIDLVVTESTIELIDIIKDCFLFIGNDSGPVHIANLLGKPTYTIYGPTNPDFHKPLTGINEFVIKDMECSPKHNNKMCITFGGVYCPSFECMHNLRLSGVKKQIFQYLNKIKSPVTVQ